ncbi:MAG: TolC family outer membrane protein [Alphaproteobacteria bacterium]|nr:TolC family outer membrane protein [Alphaproteobacteria bacterium]
MAFGTKLLGGVAMAAFAGVMGVAGVVGLGGCPASAQTLEQALIAAYDTNPTLQAERAQLRTVDESVPQALGAWRPNVNLIGDYGVTRIRGNRNVRDDTRDFFSSGLEVTQNIYEGGAKNVRISQAEADVRAARARLTETEQDVLFDVVTAYMDTVRDTAVVSLNGQNVTRLRRQLEATQDRFEVGEVTRTDVAQAESRLSRALADLIAAEGDLEVSRAAYEQVVGELPGELTTPTAFPGIPASRDEAIVLARDRNPAVRAAIHDLESADFEIRIQAAQLLPTVDITAEATRTRNRSSSDTTVNQLSLIGSVTVPIYQQGVVGSEIREARQASAEAQQVIDQTRRTAVENATSAWEIYESAVAQIDAREDEVRATTIALDGVEQEAEVGSRTVLDVLDAEQELLDAQVSLVGAQRDEVVALYGLVSSVGSLTAADLNLSVSTYDPAQYYGDVRDRLYDFEVWNEIFPGISDSAPAGQPAPPPVGQ